MGDDPLNHTQMLIDRLIRRAHRARSITLADDGESLNLPYAVAEARDDLLARIDGREGFVLCAVEGTDA